jgi:hypothetical protein
VREVFQAGLCFFCGVVGDEVRLDRAMALKDDVENVWSNERVTEMRVLVGCVCVLV